jgi:hypothetical protein
VIAGVVGLFVAPLTGLLAAVLTIASQMINDNAIYPRVMSGTVELHPGIILVAIFIGGTLGGIFGMLCAVPMTSAIKSIFVYYFEKRTGRKLLSDNGALFKSSHPRQTAHSFRLVGAGAKRKAGGGGDKGNAARASAAKDDVAQSGGRNADAARPSPPKTDGEQNRGDS